MDTRAVTAMILATVAFVLGTIYGTYWMPRYEAHVCDDGLRTARVAVEICKARIDLYDQWLQAARPASNGGIGPVEDKRK